MLIYAIRLFPLLKQNGVHLIISIAYWVGFFCQQSAPMISFANIQNNWNTNHWKCNVLSTNMHYQNLQWYEFPNYYRYPTASGLVAEEQGCGAAYRDLMLKGMWEEDVIWVILKFSDYVKQLGLNPEKTLKNCLLQK